jgi:microcystin-dependent protein
MIERYIGEIRMFAGDYAPEGWALCNGQLLQISENELLFSLLGTTYGGDGVTTFGLPDLRGRLPVHPNGSTILRGSTGGTEAVTLTPSQLPVHTHPAQAIEDEGTTGSPNGAYWSNSGMYHYADGSVGSLVTMNPQAIQAAGNNEPHDNMMPSLSISFIIALSGLYPPQN